MKTVSLVLTTYNSMDNLARTLESIEKQDYPAVEVNIKDGGSTDGTLEIIKNYAETSHNKVNWTSSQDKGIYDAMNQGYVLATGEIIVFFNDLFVKEDSISKMMNILVENPECVGAHADLVYATDDRIIRYWKMGDQKDIHFGWMPGHPTLFLQREIYEKYGLYDADYKVSADYEFMIRFLKDKENRLAYVPEVIIRMYYGGTSTSSAGSYITSLREGHRALKKNNIKGAYAVSFLRTCRVLLQFISRKS